MPKVACVMMQKNESGLLQPWLTYHGYLFGFENLFVFDNGSTNQTVLETLDLFARIGVKIDRSRSTRQDYLDKGIVVANCIRQLQKTGQYDIIMPLDCDEFVVRKVIGGITCDKDDIHNYLEHLVNQTQVLRVPYQFANNPLVPDIYSFFNFHKIFFSAAPCEGMDHGYHLTDRGICENYCVTDIIHLHFHNRPFRHLLAASREKWNGSIEYTNVESMKKYSSGASVHLRSYFIESEMDYYKKFLYKPFVLFTLFRRWLLSISPDIDLRYDNSEHRISKIEPVLQQVPSHLTEKCETYIPIASNKVPSDLSLQKISGFYGFNLLYKMCNELDVPSDSMSSNFFVNVPFYEDKYILMNKDIADFCGNDAYQSPVKHFFETGFRELYRPLTENKTILETASVVVSLI